MSLNKERENDMNPLIKIKKRERKLKSMTKV
jgi:hypothetical protein